MSIKAKWVKYTTAIRRFDLSTIKNLGIGKTLLLWFLAISLIPIATLSFINFFYYYQGLNILAKKSLVTTSELRNNYLQNYFREMERYLVSLGNSSETAETAKSGYKPEGVINVYYIDSMGVVRWQMYPDSDTGLNLLMGERASSRFSKTVAGILENGQTLFSDLEISGEQNKEISGFLGRPVKNQQGRNIGVMGVRFNPEAINRIIQLGIVFGNTGYAYLVGTDLQLRASSRIGDSYKILETVENNEKTRTWQKFIINHTTLTPKASAVAEEADIYQNSKNIPVMGLYRNLDFLRQYGVNWALVEEFEQDEAHMVASRLSTFVKIYLILTTLFVLFLSTYVTNRFVTPIKKIADWAKQVSHGELVIREIPVANNEVGKMRDAFNWLVNSLRSFASVSQSVSLGDFSKSVTVRSEKDVMAISMNKMVESFKDVVRQARSIASGDYSTNIVPRSENDTLGIALFEMTRKLREASIEINNQDWLKTGLNELATSIRGDKTQADLSEAVIGFLCRYLPALTGHIFLLDNTDHLNLAASFAAIPGEKYPDKIRLGEGIIGQVALEQKPIYRTSGTNTESRQVTGIMGIVPTHFMATPISFEGHLIGVLELGTDQPFNDKLLNFINLSVENIAVAMHTARSRERVQELLIKTQEQARELETQAKALETASNYKSEFLANMSHELRTPLNSILVLSENLATNSNRTLSAKEVEYATVIHHAGKDLLDLINDILDLSKVEAGKFDINTGVLMLDELVGFVNSLFTPLTNKKNIYLKTDLAEDLPAHLITDGLRVRQIIRNLVSNAIKFTEKGGITFTVKRPDPGWRFNRPELNPDNCIAFCVSDTGIGIPREKLELIFEAFQQADGTITRKFGGTGLGLTISKSLAELLGGEIHVSSHQGSGSTFTLILPLTTSSPQLPEKKSSVARPAKPNHMPEITSFPMQPESEVDFPHAGKTILVCDSDMRNVFALSGILESLKLKVIVARSITECLDKLEKNPDIGLLLLNTSNGKNDNVASTGGFTQLLNQFTVPVILMVDPGQKLVNDNEVAGIHFEIVYKPVDSRLLIALLIRSLES
jgi:signal transduction histidine kinase/HAMP domain-containing protein